MREKIVISKGGKIIRVGKGLLEKLEVIKSQEIERGNINASYLIAGEILSRRIDNVGGLKQ